MLTEINTLILSGGAMKGIAYCGAFKKLEEMQHNEEFPIKIKRIIAVSIGAMFGLIYLIGYKPEEMMHEIREKRFSELKNVKLVNLFKYYGFDSGDNIISWLETLMIKRGYLPTITFKELHDKIGIHFQMAATNMDTYELDVFDYINTPDMCVLKALRLSMSIPLIFTAQQYNNTIYVDGALINNCPVSVLDDDVDVDSVLCFKFTSGSQTSDNSVKDLYGFLTRLFLCMVHNRNKSTLEKFKKQIIMIYTGQGNMLDFGMTTQRKEELFNAGYTAMCDYKHSDMMQVEKDCDTML